MKTTIDIPELELKEAMHIAGAKTKREAVLAALREYNARHRMAALVKYSDSCSFDLNETIEEFDTADTRGRGT